MNPTSSLNNSLQDEDWTKGHQISYTNTPNSRVSTWRNKMVSSASIPSASAAIVKVSSAGRHSRVAFSFQNLQSNPTKVLFPLCKAHPQQRICVHRCLKVTAHLDEVVGSFSTDGAATKSEAFQAAGKEAESVEKHSPLVPMSEEAISEFLTQVASLVKLVDSRDVAELQLKKLDCELIIRKKEALPQPPASAPVVMMHQPPPPAAIPSQYMQFPAPATSPEADASSYPSPPPSVPKPAKSFTHPPLKSPMAGTFYRSPAPGSPPFVKVGDQVKKGQVLCIIEAMKLMNEIEADQAGKVTEILVDSGKTVSVDQPLFVIEP